MLFVYGHTVGQACHCLGSCFSIKSVTFHLVFFCSMYTNCWEKNVWPCVLWACLLREKSMWVFFSSSSSFSWGSCFNGGCNLTMPSLSLHSRFSCSFYTWMTYKILLSKMLVRFHGIGLVTLFQFIALWCSASQLCDDTTVNKNWETKKPRQIIWDANSHSNSNNFILMQEIHMWCITLKTDR